MQSLFYAGLARRSQAGNDGTTDKRGAARADSDGLRGTEGEPGNFDNPKRIDEVAEQKTSNPSPRGAEI